MHLELAIVALFVFVYSLVAGRVERSVISGPMIFVIAGFLLGPFSLGWVTGDATRSDLRTLADLTLVASVPLTDEPWEPIAEGEVITSLVNSMRPWYLPT